jgi:hypothetical protein
VNKVKVGIPIEKIRNGIDRNNPKIKGNRCVALRPFPFLPRINSATNQQKSQQHRFNNLVNLRCIQTIKEEVLEQSTGQSNDLFTRTLDMGPRSCLGQRNEVGILRHVFVV